MKAYNDMIVLRPREDLDRKWASDTIIMPDSALTSADSLSIWERRDAAAVCEVVSIGSGAASFPDIQTLTIGSVVVLPLYSTSKVLQADGELFLLAAFGALCAAVGALGEPTETLRAINGYVLTKQDREAFQNRMYGGLILPDQFVSDGIPVDSGSDSIVRVCLERVVGVGSGVYVDEKLQTPEQRKGELVGFNPLASCRFRRHGTWYRLTPAEDVQFALDP